MMQNVLINAVFPVRAGSKRVANKNVRPFAGTTLLELKVKQLRETGEIEQVFVSSESAEMLALAEKAGAVPLLRAPEFATDTVPMSDVYAHIAEQMPAGDILFTHATNPLCGAAAYARCIQAYRERGAAHDSLMTVRDVKDFLYQDGRALNFDPACKPRSQDLPDVVKLTHAVGILPRSLMIECRNMMGRQPLLFRQSDIESMDIDNELDFRVAEFVFNQE
jgi:N-acylneuraminate cytidylyltransferase